MRTLGQVIAWLISKGAPPPQELINTTITAGGIVLLNHLLIFRKPGTDSQKDWFLLAAEGTAAVVSADATVQDPTPTLIELRRRGIATGDPNQALGEITYPTEPPPFVLAPRARPLTPAELEN